MCWYGWLVCFHLLEAIIVPQHRLYGHNYFNMRTQLRNSAFEKAKRGLFLLALYSIIKHANTFRQRAMTPVGHISDQNPATTVSMIYPKNHPRHDLPFSVLPSPILRLLLLPL